MRKKELEEKAAEIILSLNQPALLAKKLGCLNKKKLPFSHFDHLGRLIGNSLQRKELEAFIDVATKLDRMGEKFALVGSALQMKLENNFRWVFGKTQKIIEKNSNWYVTDILAERVYGESLISNFDQTLPCLRKLLKEKNPYQRRAVGVATHYFAKRRRKDPLKIKQLLKILKPALEEQEEPALKGIGWGLKTVGRYYEEILFGFLKENLEKKKLKKLLWKKATTYLSTELKQKLENL